MISEAIADAPDPGHHADHEAPVAGAGGGEPDREDEADDRRDAFEHPLA